MVDRNLIREFSVDEAELDQTFGQSLLEVAPSEDEMDLVYDATSRSFVPNTIVDGHVLSTSGMTTRRSPKRATPSRCSSKRSRTSTG
jgi:hypothetical protein